MHCGIKNLGLLFIFLLLGEKEKVPMSIFIMVWIKLSALLCLKNLQSLWVYFMLCACFCGDHDFSWFAPILSPGLNPSDGIRVCLHLDDKHHLAIQNVCFRGRENPFSIGMLVGMVLPLFLEIKNLTEVGRGGCSLFFLFFFFYLAILRVVNATVSRFSAACREVRISLLPKQ